MSGACHVGDSNDTCDESCKDPKDIFVLDPLLGAERIDRSDIRNPEAT
jgi:hypothetical protein